jgi:uncharacterized protein involved in cysteine biosynthesis
LVPTASLPARAPLPASAAGRLAAGAFLPFRAAGWLARRPATWRYALVPVLLTAVGLVAGIALAVPVSGKLLGVVWRPAEQDVAALAAWYAARVVLFLVLVYTAAVVLPALAAGPFMDALSARVEAEELPPAAARAGGVRRAVFETAAGAAHAVARVALLVAGLLLLAPALLVPGAWPVLAFLWTAWWTSVEWVSLPMARHLYRFSEVRAALRRVRPAGFGLGCTLAALFLLPLANLLVVPLGAVSGTLLFCELVRSGAIERRT